MNKPSCMSYIDISPKHRILLVDDSPSIHEDFRLFLAPAIPDSLAAEERELFGDESSDTADSAEFPGNEFELISAYQGKEALEIVKHAEEMGNPFRMAFVDLRMPPGWDGIETIENLWKVNPNLEIVVCSAHSDYSWKDIADRLGHTDRYQILKKPFEGIEVRQLAMTLSEKSRLRQAYLRQILDLEAAVADRSAALSEAREAQKAAECAATAKSEFLANMSHEIRTPLNGVVGMTELLSGTPLDEQQKRFVSGTKASVDCLLSLVDDILDFSKIEAGKLELDPVDFNLHSLVEDMAEILSPRAEAKGVEICCELAEDLPSMVLADANRLRQVILNLLSNAVKFTEHGRVLLRVSAERSSDTETLIRFEVHDTGIGIPDNRKDSLFQVFTQVDASMTRKFGGTGLGLALSRRLVQLFNGEIGFESEIGKGSNFWFTARLGRSSAPEPSITLPAGIEGLRAMIVDEKGASLETVRSILTRWGIACDLCANPLQAVGELQAALTSGRPYDLLVSDMQMVETDGLKFVRSVRARPELSGLPVIVLAAISQNISRRFCDEWGVSECVAKPVRYGKLLSAVKSALKRISPCDPEIPVTEVASNSHPRQQRTIKGNRRRILIAEDNEMNRLVISAYLKSMGFDCTLVEDGRSAVEYATTGTFDLVLMDWQMPEMNGVDATVAIREHELMRGGLSRSCARLPVIAVTAHATSGDRGKCLTVGMDGYVSKPIDKQALIQVLSEHLDDAGQCVTN
ncbi:MAG: response regulator [Verrucomicrobiales bacterium]